MKNLLKVGAVMLALAVLLIASSCVFMQVHAATLGSENRSISPAVTTIVMNGPIDLVLTQAATPSLQVHGDATMLSRVTTRIEGSTLYIGTRGIFINLHQPLRVEAAVPAFSRLQMLGSGDCNISGFRGDRAELVTRGSGDLMFSGDYRQLDVNMSGSGDLQLNTPSSDTIELVMSGSGNANLKGQVKNLNGKTTGSGDLDAGNLKAASVSMQVTGSSNARIYASQEARLSVRGSGDIRVFGNPAKRTEERRGSGEIIW